jgi:hypothetical protein
MKQALSGLVSLCSINADLCVWIGSKDVHFKLMNNPRIPLSRHSHFEHHSAETGWVIGSVFNA